VSVAERADAVLAMVGRDPRLALREADAVVAAALAVRDVAAASRAHRAAGLALREQGDLPAAQARLRTGVELAARGGATQAAAEARMSLAFVLVDRGRLRAALAEADRAADGLTGLPAVRVATQRALILHRTGRLEQALAGYDRALTGLRLAGDTLWQARVHNNRGLLHGQRGSLAQAEADFARACALYAELGMDLLVAESECNLGNVAALRGDAPAALAAYDRAETAPVLRHKPKPQLLLNRCQVLLSVGLFAEAQRTAERAVRELAAAGMRADLAEARLWLAEAAAAAGDGPTAVAQARKAKDAFVRQDRPGWALLARMVALRAAATPARAAELARDLAAAGWQTAALDAELIAVRATLAAGDLAAARHRLESAGAARRSGPLDMRVRGWHALALLRAADGDRPGALAALRAGLAQVEQRQAVLTASDLRVHVAVFGTELARFGLELALTGGDARGVLAWAERWRAQALRLRPVQPPADPELAGALAELRRLDTANTQAQLERRAGPTATRRRAAEDRVVRASRSVRSPLHRPAEPPPTAPELAAALGGAVLVEYVQHGDRLLALTLRGNRCRLHRLSALSTVDAPVATALAALRTLALAFGTERGRRVVRAAMDRAARALDSLLLAPVRREVDAQRLVIVPTGRLHAVPWGLLPSLAGRPVSVAPSAATWLRATRSQPAGPTVLAAGPGLRGARSEVATLAAKDPAAQAFLGTDATVAGVLAALDGAALAHIAAHGRLRTDNPLLSALELADGPLTVYDIERLRHAPGTVILPACQSGVSAVHPGDEMLGLVTALLTLGTRTVVAASVPVSDVDTEPLMLGLHEGLRRGDPPADALAAVRAAVDPSDDSAVAVAASFVCAGA
jgi:tetratricopeptide (TPR) repeat protein